METINGAVPHASSISGSVSRSGAVFKAELMFARKELFPEFGSEEYIYVATDENICYRFDSAASDYVRIGVGFTSIQCKLKEE